MSDFKSLNDVLDAADAASKDRIIVDELAVANVVVGDRTYQIGVDLAKDTDLADAVWWAGQCLAPLKNRADTNPCMEIPASAPLLQSTPRTQESSFYDQYQSWAAFDQRERVKKLQEARERKWALRSCSHAELLNEVARRGINLTRVPEVVQSATGPARVERNVEI